MANRFVNNRISYHGPGAIAEIITEVNNHNFKKALVCSDPDLLKFGVTAKVTDLLERNSIAYEIYDNIQPNPTIENIQSGVTACKKAEADFIIAVGGGSSMDTAKAIGTIIANPEFADVKSLEGVVTTKNPCLTVFTVPTTAGTGAEVTASYVVTDVEKRRKFVSVDPHCVPEIAFVDPEMMSSMPKGLTAATGMDALTHAIEGYLTKTAWTITEMMSLEAIRLISKHLRSAYAGEKEGREGMALGQYIAGMGFSNVNLGIDHSMAHILSGYYGTPHGIACAILLPTAMEFNACATGEKYKEIAKAMGVEGVDEMSQDEYRKAAIDAVKKLSADVNIPTTLEGIVKEEDIPELAKNALADACTLGNPRDVTVEQIIEMYQSLMK